MSAAVFIDNHLYADRGIDMTGQTINGCLVLKRVLGMSKSARWWVMAACGHEALITRNAIRQRERNGSLPYFCQECSGKRVRPKRIRAPLTVDKRCVKCGLSKARTEFHRMTDAHDGLQSRCKACINNHRINGPSSIDCRLCMDLPWRRPLRGCRCGGHYEPEDMQTVRYHIMTGNVGKWDSCFPDCEV